MFRNKNIKKIKINIFGGRGATKSAGGGGGVVIVNFYPYKKGGWGWKQSMGRGGVIQRLDVVLT